MASSIPDSGELTRQLVQAHRPRDDWKLEVSVETDPVLYGMLLENKLNSRDLPQGDEVGFNGATYRVVIEYTWAG